MLYFLGKGEGQPCIPVTPVVASAAGPLLSWGLLLFMAPLLWGVPTSEP